MNGRRFVNCLRWIVRLAALITLFASGPALAEIATASAPPTQGEQVFVQHCSGCHSGFLGSRAPSKQVLAKFPARSIVQALATGVMRVQGYPLSGTQRRDVAEYLTGEQIHADPLTPSRGRCQGNPAMLDPTAAPQWNGWGNDSRNSSFQSTAVANLTPAAVKNLTLKWAFGFPDSFSAWSQPVVVSQRVFVGSQAGVFYSLAAPTGCTYWQFKADSGVRVAASIVTLDENARRRHGTKYAVLFGDLAGNAYALNAGTGQLLWKVKVDTQPTARITGSPVVFGGRYFVPVSSWSTVGDPSEDCCTFRGSLAALDVSTGALLWRSFTIPSEARLMATVSRQGRSLWGPSGSPIWAPPVVDARRRLIYVGTGDSYTGAAINSDSILAFDLDTGALRWSRQLTPNDIWVSGCASAPTQPCEAEIGPDFDIGSPPMLVTVKQPHGDRDLIVVGQKSGVAYALDPDRQGAILWQYRAGEGGPGGGIVWGAAAEGSTVYFPVSDITAPKPGGLHALNVVTGARRWVALPGALLCGSLRYGCNAAQPVGIAVIPGVLFAGSVDGGFRAYSTEDGSVLWEYDTNRDFVTVNEVPANGGSLIGAGPTVAGGMVFVNSGYGTNGGRAGNVLLAFSLH
jgi:polyvinyl alcohol dehydrogenase (cytochrome)